LFGLAKQNVSIFPLLNQQDRAAGGFNGRFFDFSGLWAGICFAKISKRMEK